MTLPIRGQRGWREGSVMTETAERELDAEGGEEEGLPLGGGRHSCPTRVHISPVEWGPLSG